MEFPRIHGKQVNSIFGFYGKNENARTNAFVWILASCPVFVNNTINIIFNKKFDLSERIYVSTQDYEADKGVTDIEITDNKEFYIIIEAKRGWVLPDINQLELYSHRKKFNESPVKNKAIITMSECSQEFANIHLPTIINGFNVYHISWKEIFNISNDSIKNSTLKQKWLLYEFNQFLGRLTKMQNKDSNWVYVVSLAHGTPEGWGISWIDIVKSRSVYFHPVGVRGWPAEPPNYIAFRYNGRLQSIHHIESYEIFYNPHLIITEIPNRDWEAHFLYRLGKSIEPINVVKTGKRIVRAMRVWAMLDTLLTSSTIEEARDISKDRLII